MLSNRTIKFLTVAALIVVAVFATTSMIDLSHPVIEHSMVASNAQGLAQYHQSERTGYSKEAGLAIYFDSERSIPIGSTDPFDKLRHDGPGR
jgi:hypothetical protein